MKYPVAIFSLLFAFLVTSGCQSSSKITCGPEVRAAFDVGSGSTKMKVAEFNTCTQQLTKVLLEDQMRVNYQDALQASGDLNFPAEVQTEGLDALKALKERALEQKAIKFAGVATAAFRKAKNGNSYIEQVQKELHINIRVIPQEREALIGFKGAAALSQVPDRKLFLWDIGGGSQQMVALDEKRKPQIYYGDLASVSFKNYIISEIQKENIQKVNSPNPLKRSTTLKAVQHAEYQARNTVPADLQEKILNSETVIVGIGGVLARSISDQVPHSGNIDSNAVLNSLNRRQSLSDKEIGGKFPQTEISNLALVYGFMKALKIKSFRPLQASLIDGLWYESDFWQ